MEERRPFIFEATASVPREASFVCVVITFSRRLDAAQLNNWSAEL